MKSILSEFRFRLTPILRTTKEKKRKKDNWKRVRKLGVVHVILCALVGVRLPGEPSVLVDSIERSTGIGAVRRRLAPLADDKMVDGDIGELGWVRFQVGGEELVVVDEPVGPAILSPLESHPEPLDPVFVLVQHSHLGPLFDIAHVREVEARSLVHSDTGLGTVPRVVHQ